MQTFKLADDELAATVAALHAYRFETQSYIRSSEPSPGNHDDCCPTARQRDAMMRERHEALKTRLREIDGALLELDPQT